MDKLPPEPLDVDFIVGGVERDPDDDLAVSKYIEEYKSRPEYPAELERARQALAEMGISTKDYGIPDPQALLDHWHRTVAELRAAEAKLRAE